MVWRLTITCGSTCRREVGPTFYGGPLTPPSPRSFGLAWGRVPVITQKFVAFARHLRLLFCRCACLFFLYTLSPPPIFKQPAPSRAREHTSRVRLPLHCPCHADQNVQWTAKKLTSMVCALAQFHCGDLTGTEVLGITNSASKAEIKKAYHKVCAPLQYHTSTTPYSPQPGCTSAPPRQGRRRRARRSRGPLQGCETGLRNPQR
jgi:hypothetical protein